jgi:hypothetical protein
MRYALIACPAKVCLLPESRKASPLDRSYPRGILFQWAFIPFNVSFAGFPLSVLDVCKMLSVGSI